MNALEKAIEMFGSQKALAEELGVVPMAVTNWKTRGVPIEQCPAIERVTKGAVTKHDLRPDFFDPPPAVTDRQTA